MELYNDEWSRCSVCFEDYSEKYRPTTFVCGHSVCINHVNSKQPLLQCPICKHRIEQNDSFHVSYSLEEAARVFYFLKNSTPFENSFIKEDKTSKQPADTIDAIEEQLRRNEALLDEIHPSTVHRTADQPEIKSCRHECYVVNRRTCCRCSEKRKQTQSRHHGDENATVQHSNYCLQCQITFR